VIDKTRERHEEEIQNVLGIVTEIERYSIYDGPGIRSVIFLKGCPLSCIWCCNPETQRKQIEIIFFKDKCIYCQRCIEACPYDAISINGKCLRIDRLICERFCFGKVDQFKCESSCYMKALNIMGKKITVREIFNELIRDYGFYERSSGGITISGGEPLNQPEFVISLLKYCKDNLLDTALETSGCGKWSDLKKIAGLTDVIFVDIKTIDEERHFKWTGISNKSILLNIKRLGDLVRKSDTTLFIRIPIITGLNDMEEEIRNTGLFIRNECKGIKGVELLPYHRMGRSKYKSLGLDYRLENIRTPEKQKMLTLEKEMEKLGIEVFNFPI